MISLNPFKNHINIIRRIFHAPTKKAGVVPVPKHKFKWEQPLNIKEIMDDDKSRLEAISSLSNMDNQLSEAFDQGRDPRYDVMK